MKFVVRADASHYVGSGHIMRCLVLARALQELDHEVSFACLPQSGDMIDLIEQQGFAVQSLTPVKEPLVPSHDADYLGWLQRSAEQDAQDFLSHIHQADWVITDHYAIDKTWQELVREQLGCRIFAIDDLCRIHDADIVLDQTLGCTPTRYPETKHVLAGSEYALLKPEFSVLREQALDKKAPTDKIKVLVSMGGVDAPNTTLSIVKVLASLTHLQITVLLSPRAPHYQAVSEFCAHYAHIQHLDFSSDMAGLMLEQDMAIGAPGTTSWERCCLGLPSIIIPIADNQQEIARQLVLFGAAKQINIDEIDTQLPSTLENLIKHWNEIQQACLSVCDGLGLYKTLQAILSSPISSQLQLIPANEQDIELIYQWQCHPLTRQYALNSDVPSWEGHVHWMKNKLASTDYFYMIKQIHREHSSCGALRLDRQSQGQYLISIFIAPENYGQGIASQALAMVDQIHPHITIKATVLTHNTASQKLFEHSSFTRISEQKFVRPPIQESK
ncbi:UDP-2,4-diacetamido-2,4,6-trideoxy-beta-L-altropyranose hydrolase [Shewanella algae]|uniref:UDP-2,4-diacetamido-2,4, 6-trideoxy-beta-L-altropyranose hydrolase n=1 Tax=Shewanella algae TaxID=38313 RepID=UPI0011B5EE92|nr:UDP-2,4-diacetamido-2,4,6-trideoxy-beta-L-altropyranose hydrolase [Shewanella algae]TWU69330.1 UDP-2,4-diacetamido-2,4,6-trideoxy-beta-L-altropyranose hydrolase [Shewanella algae]